MANDNEEYRHAKAQTLNEDALDSVMITFRCPLELKYRVLSKFGGDKRNDSAAFTAAFEDAAKDVVLSEAALDRILEVQVEAYKERMRRRLLKKGKR